MDIKRYSIAQALGALPDPEGPWVRYEDVIKWVDQRLEAARVKPKPSLLETPAAPPGCVFRYCPRPVDCAKLPTKCLHIAAAQGNRLTEWEHKCPALHDDVKYTFLNTCPNCGAKRPEATK